MNKQPIVITLTLGQVPFVVLGTGVMMLVLFAALGFKVFVWGA